MYACLLDDIRHTLRIPIGAPLLTDEWVLVEAPRLDKKILRWFEDGGENPPIPEWLTPLWDAALARPDLYLIHLRTILNFAYKAEYAPTQQQLQEAEASFVEVESAIEAWDMSQDVSSCPFWRSVRSLIHRVLSRATMGKFLDSIPKHGPGAVFPPRKPWMKSCFTSDYVSIRQFYAWDTTFQGIFLDAPDEGPCNELPDIVCRMVAVPKDSRGPRLICVHPSEAIWVQQSQRLVVEQCISESPLTRGFINFDDQLVNGNLAIASSIDKSYCTIDLKEASDRLSNKLVSYLLGSFSDLLGCARATHCQLLSGRTIRLRKWAPMGNCLTFPIESLIFWAIAYMSIYTQSRQRANVYVFGDDIIIPSSSYDLVIRRLVSAGLVPNFDKTFRKGSFRESCGVDAYSGFYITPLRTKVGRCVSYAEAESLCNLARRAWKLGYRYLPCSIYSIVRQFLNKHGYSLYPCNDENASGIYEYKDITLDRMISEYSYIDGDDRRPNIRWNFFLHRFECLVLQPHAPVKRMVHSRWNVLDGLLNLLRGELTDGLTYANPSRSQPKLGWIEIR
jgi:hypothetical protein